MKIKSIVVINALAISLALSNFAQAEQKTDLVVGITSELQKLEFTLDNKKHAIMRNQNQRNTINPDFAKTSRKCPPFCIQPIVIAPGVETLGEIEVIKYIYKMADGDKSILVVDSRTPDWVAKGTIPGAINIPWTEINSKKGATTLGIVKVMTEYFGAKLKRNADEFAVDDAVAAGNPGKVFDYSNAKTLVMFCNGMWCGQSPTNIKDLVNRFRYPANKIKWYRGGMQSWESLGLSTVK